ncbi:hypothetical protein PILCRDRAFT_752806 [Piloderma croceum F 1598]|uniref:Uncharacterized protein n=1 Tax=Piloderma croceum (strain F 1598) TaxID=765440 RepID=A0A0C3ACK5_PILCF|nr:hypothetical protein PILCRDRAFT_752806 [Piloderma croceum F 1598]
MVKVASGRLARSLCWSQGCQNRSLHWQDTALYSIYWKSTARWHSSSPLLPLQTPLYTLLCPEHSTSPFRSRCAYRVCT